MTVLGAEGVTLPQAAREDLARIEPLGRGGLPICLAKAHLSIRDDAKVLGRPAPLTLRITGLRANRGAGFVVALCGPILMMPGLPEEPAAAVVDIERLDDGSFCACGLG